MKPDFLIKMMPRSRNGISFFYPYAKMSKMTQNWLVSAIVFLFSFRYNTTECHYFYTITLGEIL